MTEQVHSVIRRILCFVSSWTYEKLVRITAAFSNPDEGDPRKARKRRRILDAATRLFIQHGYRRASVDEVARLAGMAKGTVYLYFPSKADLLVHALLAERTASLERFRPVFDSRLQGAERLHLWLTTLLDSLNDQPLTSRILQGDREILAVLDDLDHDLVEHSIELKVDFLAPMIAEARTRETTEEDRITARVLMATFQSAGFFQDERLRLGVDQEVFFERIVDLMVAGIVHVGDRGAATTPAKTARAEWRAQTGRQAQGQDAAATERSLTAAGDRK